jgi:hypothetical protein
MHIGLVSFALLSVGLRASPAHALPPQAVPSQEKDVIVQEKNRVLTCLSSLQSTLSSTPQPVPLGQSPTLSWNATVPSTSLFCTGIDVKLYVDGQVVPPVGSLSMRPPPIADTASRLIAAFGGAQRTLATAASTVDLPERPAVITITENSMRPLLLQALKEGNKHIVIANRVEMDLSGLEYITIGERTTLAGGRTAREDGPRLYTTTRPAVLFDTQGDHIRITGLRIEGPDHPGVVPEDDEPDKGVGILIYADINIEIDHNEIYGWSQAAIRVNDCDGMDWCAKPATGRMRPSEYPNAVYIHDNYIHHNQHQGKNGYGVALHNGAYVLIERNVFDWNRHAIAGDGAPGTGTRRTTTWCSKTGGTTTHTTPATCRIGSRGRRRARGYSHRNSAASTSFQV